MSRLMQPRGVILLVLLRFALALVFFWAGLLKLQAPEAAQMAIFQYKLVSWEMAGVLATLIPMLECSTACGLLIPRLHLGGAALGIGLLLVFCGALASALARGLDISCGCFGGVDAHTPALRRLLEDVLLLGLCCILWRDSALRFHQGLTASSELPPQNR
jgi:putative oxidoreductase